MDSFGKFRGIPSKTFSQITGTPLGFPPWNSQEILSRTSDVFRKEITSSITSWYPPGFLRKYFRKSLRKPLSKVSSVILSGNLEFSSRIPLENPSWVLSVSPRKNILEFLHGYFQESLWALRTSLGITLGISSEILLKFLSRILPEMPRETFSDSFDKSFGNALDVLLHGFLKSSSRKLSILIFLYYSYSVFACRNNALLR